MADLYKPVNPEDTVKARKKVLSEYVDIAQPAKAAKDKWERDELSQNIGAKTGALQTPRRTEAGIESAGLQGLGTLGVLTQGASQMGTLMGQQGIEQDKLNAAGATLQQQIAGAKTKQATTNTLTGMENETQRLARAAAQYAFDQGIEAKQLILSENSALSDYAFEALQKDFQAGRVSAKELRDVTNKLRLDAEKKRKVAEIALEDLKRAFELDMSESNAQRTRSRVLALYKAKKDALIAVAKAQATAKMSEGITDVVSTVAEEYGGPIVGKAVKAIGGYFSSGG